MAQCPKCQAQIEIGSQFYGGLFTCPHCQAVYFISFDGVPEGQAGGSFEPELTPSFEPFIPTMENTEYQQPQIQSFEALSVQSSSTASDEFISTEPVSPIQDIVNFGNQEAAATPLMFSLKIKGLDIAQNVSDLQVALSDAKLGFKFEELKKKIKNGELTLDRLDPAKAAVIAQRLRALPIQMEWEQKIYE